MARAGSPSRADLLAAAERLLRTEGLGGLTVRALARSVAASRQVVYSRFGAKDGLLRALHDEGFRRLAVAIEAIPEPAGTDAHILATAEAYRRTARDAPELFELMFNASAPAAVLEQHARPVARDAFDGIVRGAQAWLEAHGARHGTGESVSLAHALWAATHGIVSLERAGHLSGPTADRELAALLNRVLHGSVVDGSPTPT